MKKLSFYQTYMLIGLIGFSLWVPSSYYFLGAERSYHVLVDIIPYGGAYVVGMLYQLQLEPKNLSLYPIPRKEIILHRMNRIFLALLNSSILYTLFSGFLHLFNPIDLEKLITSLLILFALEEIFTYRIESLKILIILNIILCTVVIGLGAIIPNILQLVLISLFVLAFCIFWMYRQSARTN